jgi:FkbM family methyltransferase
MHADEGLVRVRLPNGMSVAGLTEPDTLSVYYEIFENRCYRQHGITLTEGDTILDVGANTGLFALWLNTVLSRARVYCFEPVPAIHEALVLNLDEHDRLQTEAINAGLSNQAGDANFVYYPHFSNASTMFPDKSERMAQNGREWVISQAPALPVPLGPIISWLPAWAQSAIAETVRRYHMRGSRVRCKLTTLSAFLRQRGIERVDLLKIDAERSESLVLAGLAEADWPRIRQIVMEVHDGEQATRDALELLRARGFRAEAEPNPAMPGLSLVYAVRP